MNSQIELASKKSGHLSPIGYQRIDITSHARDIFRQCSPFFLGPIPLYGGLVAKTMENAWQYTKVYRPFVDTDENPAPKYLAWAEDGFNSMFANPFPMGVNVPYL